MFPEVTQLGPGDNPFGASVNVKMPYSRFWVRITSRILNMGRND